MKNIVVFIGILILAVMVVSAEDFQQRFDSANELYEKGCYTEALELYRTIENSMFNWKLFYNMGNCQFKLNRFIEAKIYYLKARQLKPLQSSIEKNIQIVNKNFKDKIPEKEIDFLGRVVLKVESLISLNFISYLLIVFIIMFNFSLFILVKRRRNKWALYGLFFFLLLSIFTSMLHIYRVQKRNSQNTAVIIRDNAQLRSGPGQDNTVLFKVNPGLEVRIIDRSNGWLQVSASSDITGWIQEDRLSMI
jgi:tetratricopeptide (TPR) repeat protein